MEHFNIKIVDSVDMNWSPNSTQGTLYNKGIIKGAKIKAPIKGYLIRNNH